MGSKEQLALLPISSERDGGGGSVDGKVAKVRERPSPANASFRVYYSLRAGSVPFLWESAPGTPKTSAVAPESGAADAGGDTMLLPAISPPPSYQSSLQLKGKKGCRTRSSWPAGGIVRVLLEMLGLGAKKC